MEVFRLTAEASLLMGPRYIAVALWVLIAKGKGKIVADVPKLMETIFPGEAFDLRVFKNWLAELKAAGVIELVKDGEQWMIRQGGGGFQLNANPRPPKKQPNVIGSRVLLVFPCSGKINEWSLTEAQVEQWQLLFPDLDVLQECRQALSWVMCNHRKTAKGMLRFLDNWFQKAMREHKSPKSSGPFGAGREEKPRGALGRALAEFGSN
jgi:hypothetical protein